MAYNAIEWYLILHLFEKYLWQISKKRDRTGFPVRKRIRDEKTSSRPTLDSDHTPPAIRVFVRLEGHLDLSLASERIITDANRHSLHISLAIF